MNDLWEYLLPQQAQPTLDDQDEMQEVCWNNLCS